jgi:hypothetical protein
LASYFPLSKKVFSGLKYLLRKKRLQKKTADGRED